MSTFAISKIESLILAPRQMLTIGEQYIEPCYDTRKDVKLSNMDLHQSVAASRNQRPSICRRNVFAVWGFVLAFFFPSVSLTFSTIAILKARGRAGSGQGLAVAGIVLATLVLVAQFLASALLIFFILPIIFYLLPLGHFYMAAALLSLIGLGFAIAALLQDGKQIGSGDRLAIAGMVLAILSLVIQILATGWLIFAGLSWLQEGGRDGQKTQYVRAIDERLEDYLAVNDDGLPDEETFAQMIDDLSLNSYANPILITNASSGEVGWKKPHVLYVREGQPAKDIRYPGSGSLHIWGGSLCGPSEDRDGKLYADNVVEAAAVTDRAFVYELELFGRLVCEDSEGGYRLFRTLDDVHL